MTRSVFKIFGSIGPGGSISILTEKLCGAIFYDGYELKDPNLEEVSAAQEKEKKERGDYVAELFQRRGEIERGILSLRGEEAK